MATEQRRLSATFSPTRARHYRRPGGPWDRGWLESGFPSRAGGTAMVDDAGSTDRASLEDLISTVAGRLRREGIRRHDVVAFQLPNGIGAALLYRACWRLGAIAAPLHHKMGPREVAAALDQVDPVLVIAGCGLPASEIEGSVVLESPSERFDGLLARFADADPVTRAQCPAKGSDIAAVLFTSGSTGTPKAVLHTHRGLGYKASTMVEVHGIGPRDAVLSPAPLAHISGLLNGVLLPSTAGIPSVLMSTWDPEKALSLIERYEVTFMGAPPVFFTQMAASELFTQRRVATLRLVSTGGASVSPAFIDSTSEIFECRVKRTYGSTEAPTVTTSRARDAVDRARDTDGRTVGEVELQIRDPGDLSLRESGDPGEIWLRGPELFVGYADPAANAKVFAGPGGWFRTGDIGVSDERGWLRVEGRLSDTIIRGGENISASEVEATLEAHPDVTHAVAVPVPDAILGERVAAYVEARTASTWRSAASGSRVAV
ncbi:MAG TPA: AMP-binding protein [Acidimicrobiales bacterium]|nr:AMP-binding protein [Acidimicrobiales bacterium]